MDGRISARLIRFLKLPDANSIETLQINWEKVVAECKHQMSMNWNPFSMGSLLRFHNFQQVVSTKGHEEVEMF